MDAKNPSCPETCGAYEPGDNYCRRCGMYVATPELVEEARTVIVSEERPALRAIEPHRAGLPVPAQRVAAAVAVGTALQVGVALLARYMSNSAPRAVARPQRTSRRAVANREPDAPPAPLMDDSIIAVVESVTFRRTWLRRG